MTCVETLTIGHCRLALYFRRWNGEKCSLILRICNGLIVQSILLCRLKIPMTRNWMPNVIYLDLFSILNIFVGMKKKGGKGTILCTKDYYFASECHVNNRSCLVKQSFIQGKLTVDVIQDIKYSHLTPFTTCVTPVEWKVACSGLLNFVIGSLY